MKNLSIPNQMPPSGILIINKPAGITSHDVIDILRKKTGQRKIGHAGTLDPMAIGVLICGINKATKKLDQFMNLEKEYLATVKLGETSTTFDKEGEIIKSDFIKEPTELDITNALKKFTGEIWQTPPMFSAKKIKGKKMYELARKGLSIEIKPQLVKIYSIHLEKYGFPILEIRVKCSKGTYIRSLANDLGQDLKTGGYLSDLIRTKIGNFKLENAITLDSITPDSWKQFLISI